VIQKPTKPLVQRSTTSNYAHTMLELKILCPWLA